MEVKVIKEEVKVLIKEVTGEEEVVIEEEEVSSKVLGGTRIPSLKITGPIQSQ